MKKGKVILIKRVRTDVLDIGRLFEMIEADEKDLSEVMEATGFCFWIHDLIVTWGHDVVVVHPSKAKDMMKSMSKTDKNDAFMLADLLNGIYVPSVEIREMRNLTRHRESLVWKKGDLEWEIITALDLRSLKLKVPSDFRTNFTEKYKG
jgi:transposase